MGNLDQGCPVLPRNNVVVGVGNGGDSVVSNSFRGLQNCDSLKTSYDVNDFDKIRELLVVIQDSCPEVVNIATDFQCHMEFFLLKIRMLGRSLGEWIRYWRGFF